MELLEDPGPGLVWYSGPENPELQLPVLQNTSTRELFVVSPSMPPMILDVNCVDGMGNSYGWSRITGDVTLRDQVAFNLNPESGTVSGVPALDLSDTQGRASVVITCQIALGGPTYDKVLPVADLTVKIMDDVCWVPSNVSKKTLWQKLEVNQAACLRMCRLRVDCAAARYNGTCYIMVSEGGSLLNFSRAMVRLNNCSEETATLELSVPGALYVQGNYTPTLTFKHQARGEEGIGHGGSLDLVKELLEV